MAFRNSEKSEILVIDDTPANLQLLTDILEKSGYRVRPASSAQLGLRSAEAKLPDLILLDVKMPDMDGYELCRRLKAQENTRKVPILFISALHETGEKLKGFKAGAVDFITKPFEPEEVLARVQTHLQLYELSEKMDQKVRERTAQLQKTNQAYKALSNCSQAIVRAQDEDELLQRLFKVIIDDCGYNFAWAGLIENNETGHIKTIIPDGFEKKYAEPIASTITENESSARRAMREKTAVINSYINEDTESSCSINKEYASAISIPLITTGNEVLGVITIYSAEPDAFNAEQINFLAELISDLTYGISALRAQEERKQAENELRANQERYALAQKAANVGSWDLDFLSDTLHWSEQIEPMFGFKQGEFGATYEAFLECVHPDDREFVISAVSASLDRNKEYNIEHRIVWRDKTVRWVSEIGTVFRDETNKPVRMLGVVQDITERKLAEERRMELIRDLEQKNAEMERFTYTVSHDLKTPLVTIEAFLNLLRKDICERRCEGSENIISRMMNASTKMRSLLDDLLNISKAGHLSISPEFFSLHELTTEAIELVTGQIIAKNVSVIIDSDFPEIYGDRTRLLEVMLNLIDNAVKFSSGMDKPEVHIGCCEKNGKTVFYVKDNGVGIDPHYTHKIFKLFEKLDANTDGNGIGLTLVKRIIESHQGSIWVESEGIQKGATFYFTLNLARNSKLK
ncbi:MAG: response regulator [Candidatus Auribacter fodinae]|jgi:PAS domain S-box-containing protein|uniref:histidine kinase n=1 Tax=Candidatus Auribacter fodinae TaxID=2093366 RepID=A0A3A4RAE3_9BACT|nr:MAG: response regulator [Candidatus Auribacter fodinae]